MGKPKAPAPPDYAAAAKAQGEANVNSSLATNYMNQVNQVGPYGSITYNRSATDGYTLPDGTFIPNTTLTTTLSPEQQKLYDQNVGLSTQLNDLAAKGIGYVEETANKPVDLSGLPPQTTSVAQALYKSQADQGNLGLQTVGQGPTYSTLGSGPTYSQMGASPTLGQASKGPTYQALGPGGQIQNSVQGTDYQNQYDFSGVSQMPKYEDFNSSRDRVTDAMMQRLQPYIDRDREALRTQLTNQGVGQGTEAYGWDMDLFQRGVNDQRIAALLAGGQEQQNLFNNAMGLRQQGVQEAFAQGNLKNSVADALFNQRMQQGNFANSAQAQQFGQDATRTGYNNGLADQAYQNERSALDFNNNAAIQQAGLDRQATSYNNDLAARGFADQQTTAGFNNDVAGKGFADSIAAAGVNNQAQQQEYAQNQQDLLNYNQAQEAQFNQGLASGQFANQARNQALQEMDYQRNAPLNMLNALRSGNQVQTPTFVNAATGAQITPAPVYNATADKYAAEMSKYNAQMQQYGGFLSGLGSLGAAAIMSDRRLKTNIVKIGERPDGLGVYSYDYTWGTPAIGVMADEVAALRPDALGPVIGGYQTVNYGAL